MIPEIGQVALLLARWRHRAARVAIAERMADELAARQAGGRA